MGCGIDDRNTRISSEEKIRIKYARVYTSQALYPNRDIK